MTGERTSKEQLDMRIREAYEALSPSDEVQRRVLMSLRAAQEQKNAGPPVRMVRRRWLIALPIAACLLAVAIVVWAGALQKPQAAKENSATYGVVSNTTTVPVDEAEEQSKTTAMDEEVAADAAAEAPVRAVPYSVVTLESGKTFEVGDSVLGEPQYDKVEQAVASNPATSESVSCIVADEAYVKFEDDSLWYELV